MGDGDVNVLGGNSSAFRVLVISLTIFLGALIGEILFLSCFFIYTRDLRIRTMPEPKLVGNYSHCFTAQLLPAYFFAGSSYFVNFFVT